MTGAPVTPCINEALPSEVFGVIFEEHAKMDWRAPVIDGQVCRLWRQIILCSPRAWAHLEIGTQLSLTPSKLCQWLDRSGTAPLHLKVFIDTQGIEKVLDQHHKRIKSLTVCEDSCPFLEDRSFPILQSLNLDHCHTPYWNNGGGMPALRSLQACYGYSDTLPLNNFSSLRILVLHNVKHWDRFIQNSYHSLTSLLLESLEFHNASELLEFPSLRFLSLLRVHNLKPRMNVPALTTYHEGYEMGEESFPNSLPLLTEYGVLQGYKYPPFTVTSLHECYPNLSRLSIRVCPSFVKPFLQSLVGQPTALPMLRILAVEDGYSGEKFSREDKHSMINDVLVRNMASGVKMELCFDGSFRVPLYFGMVRVCNKEDKSKLTSTLRAQICPFEGLGFVLGLWPCY
jgi:hypothetical protein